MTAQDEPIEIPVVYIGLEDVPIVFANSFVVQHQQNEFIVTVGQIQPPLLLGSPEEVREQARRTAYVPVKVVARLALTRARMEELLGVLTENLRRYDETSGDGQEGPS